MNGGGGGGSKQTRRQEFRPYFSGSKIFSWKFFPFPPSLSHSLFFPLYSRSAAHDVVTLPNLTLTLSPPRLSTAAEKASLGKRGEEERGGDEGRLICQCLPAKKKKGTNIYGQNSAKGAGVENVQTCRRMLTLWAAAISTHRAALLHHRCCLRLL